MASVKQGQVVSSGNEKLLAGHGSGVNVSLASIDAGNSAGGDG